MNFYRFLLSFAFIMGLLAASPTAAHAGEKNAKARSAGPAKKDVRKKRVKRICTWKNGKRTCRPKGAKASGHGVSQSELRTTPLPEPSGDVWIYAVNFREEVRVNIFEKDGEMSDAALASLDHGFRCKRTKTERAVNPKLFRLLSIISDHFDGKRVDVVSGFRFQTNEGSRHYHASAMDIHIPGVPDRELFEYAKTLDTGGLGIGFYPRAGFVHVDVRAPGEPSYRWVDRSPSGSTRRGKAPSRRWKTRKPTS